MKKSNRALMSAKIIFAVLVVSAAWFGYRYFQRVYYMHQTDKLMAVRQAETAKDPEVSVIMPTYNRAASLPRAINSILAQTYQNFELIVINDGAKDNTAEILYHYMLKDKRVKVINHWQNKGIIDGLNDGLHAARGKYIARMDDDDFSYEKRLEKQVEYLTQNPEITLVGSFIASGNPEYDQQWSYTNPDETKLMHYLGETPVCHPAIMVRRDFLQENNIKYRYDYIYAEDRPFYGDVLAAGGKISNVPEVLFHFRVHSSNSHEYYSKQDDSCYRYHMDYINLLLDVNMFEYLDKCRLLRKLSKYNEGHNWVSPQAIEVMRKRHKCVDEPQETEDEPA